MKLSSTALVFLLIIFPFWIHSQILNTVVFAKNDTIALKLRDYCQSNVSWQQSIDGTNWSKIEGFIGNDILVNITNFDFDNKLIRAQVKYQAGDLYNYSSPFSVKLIDSFTQIGIGDYYDGTLVYHEFGDTLICGQFSRKTSEWGCTNTLLEGTKEDIGLGQHNSEIIIDRCSSNSAALFAKESELHQKNDWFLPSLHELQAFISILKSQKINYYDQLDFFWSSTELNDSRAMGVYYRLGGVSSLQKKNFEAQIALSRFITIDQNKSKIAETFLMPIGVNENIIVEPNDSCKTEVAIELNHNPQGVNYTWDLKEGEIISEEDVSQMLVNYEFGGYNTISCYYENETCYSQVFKSQFKVELFQNHDLGLPAIYKGEVNSIDFNNDDLNDLFVIGSDNAELYLQDLNGDFTLINTTVKALRNAYSSWGDFNNDGFIDLAICGYSLELGLSVSEIYLNENGNTLIPYENDLIGVQQGNIKWLDYNNDGNLDLIVSGMKSDSLAETRLYLNSNQQLIVDPNNSIKDLAMSSISIDDYNRDGWSDILINGKGEDGRNTLLYKNELGTFRQLELAFTPTSFGETGFADFDQNGTLDIVITGQKEDILDEYYGNSVDVDTRQSATTEFYSNDQFDSFSFVNELYKMDKYVNSGIDIGDYNNDGIDDIIIAGLPYVQWVKIGTIPPTSYIDRSMPKILRGSSPFNFTNIEANIPATWATLQNQLGMIEYNHTLFGGFTCSSIQFAHMNKDNVLDIIREGRGDGYSSDVLLSNIKEKNNPPSIPQNLQAHVSGDTITMTWEQSTDDFTLQSSVWYEIYIQNESGEYIVSNKNKRKIRSNEISINGLPAGNYNCAVKAVDNARLESQYSEIAYFKITSTNTEESESVESILFSPNPAEDYIKFQSSGNHQTVKLFNAVGELVLKRPFTKIFRIEGLNSGVYFIQVDDSPLEKLIVQ